MGELGHAAVHDRGRGITSAVKRWPLAQLPEQPSIRRQPQGELLHNRHRIGRSFLLVAAANWLADTYYRASTKRTPKRSSRFPLPSPGEEGG